jgi:ketosteroid isomerase-like protein
MSKENVAVVRRAWAAAWSKPPDWALLDALYHPDHVFESDYGGVNNTAYRGAGGFQEFRADQDETWADWRHELVDVIDAGSDAVVLEARLVARGKHSAVAVEQPYGVVVTVSEGKIARTQAFVSLQEALEAVGLSGRQASSPRNSAG